MKKILFTLLCLLPLAMYAGGQKVGTPKCWTVPAVYTADEKVTFYYDVTDVGFPEGVDLYLWAWQPTEPDKGNGDNSSDFAKLTYHGDNIYSITMVPTQYFNAPLSDFEKDDWPGFWQQLKTKKDEIWSSEFAAPDSRAVINDFKKSGNAIQFYSGKGKTSADFTDKFTLDQPLTVLVNPDLYKLGGRTMTEISKDANFVQFGAHAGLNDWAIQQTLDVWRPDCLKKVEVKKLSNGLYAWNIGVPSEYFASNPQDAGQPAKETKLADPKFKEDFELENLTYLIVEVIKDAKGANAWGANSGDQMQKAGKASPYPDPSFSYFPSKVSLKDILTLTRQWNEKTAGDLKYTITAGSKTLTGTMPGVRDKREVTLDLNKEFQGVTATEMQVKIDKANGANVIDTTIPLVNPE